MNLNEKLKEISKDVQKNQIKIMGSVIHDEKGELKNVYSLIAQHDSIVMSEKNFKAFINQCNKALAEGDRLRKQVVSRDNSFLA